MKLHLFNPEHDLSLANNDEHFIAPHVARQIRSDLSFLPILWAEDGDRVIVDDIVSAQRFVRSLHRKLADAEFINPSDIKTVVPSAVSVWGWDKSVKSQLSSLGVDEALLPSRAELNDIRRLSNRCLSMIVLKEMCSRIEGLCGESSICSTLQEINTYIAVYRRVVIKAPWSGSGRGVRFADTPLEQPLLGWCKNILKKQALLSVEPYYNKIKDFGMEFESDGNGGIKYFGLSTFKTNNGAYMGNIIATEHTKAEMLGKYVSVDLINRVKEELTLIFGEIFKNHYKGLFGVDMMIVGAGSRGFELHPCVEINLRRTMGHVALSLAPDDDDILYLMRIINTNCNYNLKITKL